MGAALWLGLVDPAGKDVVKDFGKDVVKDVGTAITAALGSELCTAGVGDVRPRAEAAGCPGGCCR